MSELLIKNVEYYSRFLIPDVAFGRDTISSLARDSYIKTSTSSESLALKQCKRRGFKPDNSRFWGFMCFHLSDEPGNEKLYQYAVNFAENRPMPKYYRGHEPKIIARNNNAVKMYESLDGYQVRTFCNVNTAVYIAEYGAVDIARSMLSYTVNDFMLLLESDPDGKIKRGDFTIEQLTYQDAIKYAELGLMVFAIKHGSPDGHIAPIVGADEWVNRNNEIRTTTEEKCAWCMNIGRNDKNLALDGYNSIYRSFFVTNLSGIHYYAVLRTDL